MFIPNKGLVGALGGLQVRGQGSPDLQVDCRHWGLNPGVNSLPNRQLVMRNHLTFKPLRGCCVVHGNRHRRVFLPELLKGILVDHIFLPRI